MMDNKLEYKGYYTIIEYSAVDKVLHGKLEGINDLVMFDSESAETIESEFHAAVDEYLDYCRSIGEEPDKPYKGSFNVRVDPRIHRLLASEALQKGMSLNQVVEIALKEHVYYNKTFDSATWSNTQTKLTEAFSDIIKKWSEKNTESKTTYSFAPGIAMANAFKGV